MQELAAKALQHDPQGQAIEFEGRWYTRDELRSVAERVNSLLAASGIAVKGPVCLISRNHPAVIATLLGLISEGRNVRMVYPFQAPTGIVRDIKRLEPAAFVLTAKDLSPELADALREEGISAIVLDGMRCYGGARPGQSGTFRRRQDLRRRAANRDPHQRHHRAAEAVRNQVRHDSPAYCWQCSDASEIGIR